MRFLSERIAKEANKQDECSGRFWEGRFKAQVLLNEAAILACLQYVELNPIRAGIAKTPEGSDFTSAKDRLRDLKKAAEECSVASLQCSGKAVPNADFEDVPVSKRRQFDALVEHGAKAGWLSPVRLEPKRQAVRAKKTERRALNKGFLPRGLGEYLALLDWTARQVRTDKRGSMPANLEPTMERLGVPAELWVEYVMSFCHWFRSSVGRPKSMSTHADSRGHNRAMSISSSRRLFAGG